MAELEVTEEVVEEVVLPPLVTQKLLAAFGKDIRRAYENKGDLYYIVERAKIAEIIAFLKADSDLAFDYFVECLGVDYSTWTHPRDLTERFEVIYNLYSTKSKSRIFLKLGVDDGQAVPTVKHIFLGAEYPEREIQDLYGVTFAGNDSHPGRFLLPDDWIGYPLRKEYPLGGEDVLFDGGTRGPGVEDKMVPHAGESFEGRTGSSEVSGR
jgi:NADH-quinone oxidoreductase subunit C